MVLNSVTRQKRCHCNPVLPQGLDDQPKISFQFSRHSFTRKSYCTKAVDARKPKFSSLESNQ